MSIIISILSLIGITLQVPTEMDQGLFTRANHERIIPLKWDDCLGKVAERKSKDMVERKYWSHEDTLTGEIETWGWIIETCGQYEYAGENLTKGFTDNEKAHKTLMNSPKHRKNILNKNYKRIGVGCYDYICTQLFMN
jgi:uncharacterized protein YkwD